MLGRKHLVCALVAVLSIAACTGNNKKNSGSSSVTINSEAILGDQNLSAEDKAEKLALAAEQLLTAQSFMYADEVATVALSVDSNNKRAQLIKALVGPAMATKGALTRIKPLAIRNAETHLKYEKAIADINQYPNSALKTFLMDGQPDIKNETDAQNFVASVQSAFDRLRVWLRDNKNLEMTLHIPGEFTEQAIKRQFDKCVARAIAKGIYQMDNCDLTNALEIKVNQADLEVAQHITAGYQLYLGLFNNYDLSGSIATAEKLSKGPKRDTDYVIRELLKTKSFGTLRADSVLKNVLEMGVDALAGIRYAQKMQNDLCPSGIPGEGVREGYLMSQGLCVDQDNKDLDDKSGRYKTVGELLAAIELAIRGSSMSATFTGRLGSIDTDIKPAAILENPIQDLRTLMPLRYDKCGTVIGTADATLGGVFVRGDANAVLLLNKDNCVPFYYYQGR